MLDASIVRARGQRRSSIYTHIYRDELDRRGVTFYVVSFSFSPTWHPSLELGWCDFIEEESNDDTNWWENNSAGVSERAVQNRGRDYRWTCLITREIIASSCRGTGDPALFSYSHAQYSTWYALYGFVSERERESILELSDFYTRVTDAWYSDFLCTRICHHLFFFLRIHT